MNPPDRREVSDYLAAATDRELDELLKEARPDLSKNASGLDKGRAWYQSRHGKGRA